MAHDVVMTVGMAPDDAQITRTLRHIASTAHKTLGQSINAHVQPLGRITGEANEFQKSLAASNARVIAFGASTGAIFAVRSAFKQLVRSTIEVEQQMSEINAIFQLGGNNLKRFSADLFGVANAYGMAFNDATKAAAEFARQGLTVEETLKRTSAALALSRISGTNMEQSVSSLTSIMNTFVKESLSAEDVVNRLVAVDQAYAVSAGDLAEALNRVSSSAADANVSLNQTMALITSAKQITARSASVLGNSFKTIFTRLQRPQVLDDLMAVGVQVRDTTGKIRPMIDILHSLASTYDGLAQAQKSFVAETVGGVYQINTLKAIMRDLGSGMSIYSGAMDAAGHSTDFVQKRMEILNDTMSSQLIRTANNLKEAFANIGTALLGGTMRSGINSFDTLVKNIGHYADSNTTKEGGGLEKFGANLFQGSLKGLGNFLKGPGTQFGVFALFKLFQRLETFIVQSAKDLAGLNKAEKERKAINEGIASWLGKQDDLLKQILEGHVSLAEVTERYVQEMKDAVSAAKDLETITANIGDRALTKVTFVPKGGAAGGYIPNLEIAEARRGGYNAGRVLNTTISNGLERMNITANGAESISRVVKDGNAYDFINPPRGTPAANSHERESIRKTGINPYDLASAPIRGRGFVPNLALSPELIQTIFGLGIKKEDILRHKGAKLEHLTDLPEGVVSTFVQRYRTDPRSLTAALASLTRWPQAVRTMDPKKMFQYLNGLMLNTQARENGLFPDMNRAGVEMLASSITGGKVKFASGTDEQRMAKLVKIRPEDVQRVFNLHAKSIPFIAAYEDASNYLSPAADRPGLVSPLDFRAETTVHKFQIPTPIYGHHGNVMERWKDLEQLILAETGSPEGFTASEVGTMRGTFFDKTLRGMARKAGVKVGEPGSSLDIYGPVAEILAQTNVPEGTAAMELKASSKEARASGHMAEKIFRTFAGEPGSEKRAGVLKGPVGYVPRLTNIKQFDGKRGHIGIIDADKFGQTDSSRAHYDALIYAAVASGKPLRVHYGPMTMGKTTASEEMLRKAGGMGGKGGDYVTDISQVDSEAFSQFIINKTDRTNLDSGIFGLALSAASQVRGFFTSHSDYQGRQAEMVNRLKSRNRGEEARHAEAIALDEVEWSQYAANMLHLEQKLGKDRFSKYLEDNPFAGRGFVPNLAIQRDWRGIDEDLAAYTEFDFRDEGRRRNTAQEPEFLNFKKNAGSYATWNEEEGILDIQGIYRSRGEGNPWPTLMKFIKQNASSINEINAGSIVGPRIPKVLQHFIAKARQDKAMKGITLTGEFSPSILVKEASEQVRNKEIRPKEFKNMVQAMKSLGVSDFRAMKLFNVEETFADGFVPNLWPAFPDFDLASPGGVQIRRSSMGVTDSYWARRTQKEMSRLQGRVSNMAPDDLLSYLHEQYGSEYGQKLFTAIANEKQSSISNNIKGFRGEEYVGAMLKGSGLFRGLKKLPESMGMDFMGQLKENNALVPTLIEAKNQGKIGQYDKFVEKLRTSQKNFPQHLRWLIGNDDTRYTGAGFVPNMAIDMSGAPSLLNLLGAPDKFVPGKTSPARGIYKGFGASARFFDLVRSVGGVRAGKKVFNEGYDPFKIAKEYAMTARLADVKGVNPLFHFPKVIGSMKRAMRRRAIGKETVMGQSIADTATEEHEYYNTSKPIGRVAQLAEAFQRLAHQELLEQGIETVDFVGHSKNTMMNEQAMALLYKIGRSEHRSGILRQRLGDIGESNLPLTAQIAKAMARKGARMSVIDPGLFISQLDQAPQAPKADWVGMKMEDFGKPQKESWLDKARRLMGNAGGFVPNLAFPADALMLEGAGYAPITSANGVMLRSVATGLGMDTGNMTTIDIADAIAAKHKNLFKMMCQKNLFKFPTEVPNLAINPQVLRQFFPHGPRNVHHFERMLSSVARSVMENVRSPYLAPERTQAEELEQARQYARSPHSGGDAFWQRRVLELGRRGNVRGAVLGAAHGIRQVMEEAQENGRPLSLTRDMRRTLRQIGMEIGQSHMREHGGDPWGGDLYERIRAYIAPHFEGMFPPAEVFKGFLGKQGLPEKTTIEPGYGNKQKLKIARNSSDLTIEPDKTMYVDYLRRNSWMHRPTGQVFEESNPLKAIISQINAGNIMGVRATVIGPKIPNILKQVVELAKTGKLPKGFSVDFSWVTSILQRNAEYAKGLWEEKKRDSDEFKQSGRKPSFGDSDFSEMTGFMMPDEEAKMHEAFAYFGHDVHKGVYSYHEKFGAKGIVPNLYSAAADALRRENMATGGHAMLSSDPLLRTNNNPLGIAAVDSRSQKDASQAIRQHYALGQSLSDVRRAHTGRGFVPNLAIDSPQVSDTGGMFSSMGMANSVILAVLGSIRQEATKPSERVDKSRAYGWLSQFSSEGAKAAAKLRLMTDEFDRMRNSLLKGETVTTPQLTSMGGATATLKGMAGVPILEKIAQREFAPLRGEAAPYQKAEAERTAKYSKYGLRTATAASIGGGIASQFADMISPSIGAGVTEFSNGLTQAGQVLMTFPTKFGMAAAAGLAVSAATSGLQVWSKGLHSARLSFEVNNSKFQVLNSQMDALAQSMNQYDNMIMDATVSFEAIQREQRKYSETLAQMRKTPEGNTVADELQAAPDTKSRLAIIMKDKDRRLRDQEAQASSLSLKEYAASRTFWGSKAFGIKEMGYSTPAQKTKLEQTLRGSAGAAISNINDEDLKKQLMDAQSGSEIGKILAGSKSISAKTYRDTYGGLSNETQEALQSQMFEQFQREKIENTPARKEAVGNVRQRVAARQMDVERAMEQAKLSQRMFVNSGSLRAGTQLDVENIRNQQRLNTALVSGPESTATRQAAAGVFRMRFGERSVAKYEAETDLKRISAEKEFKVGQVGVESTRGVVEALRQTFESKLAARSAELYRGTGMPGTTLPSIGGINPEDINVSTIAAVNKGIAAVVTSGNLQNFKTGAGGTIDMEKLSKAIAKNSGGGSAVQGIVEKYIKTNASEEIMKQMLEATKQVATINMDALSESQKRTRQLQGLTAELDFKQMSNYLGGIKNLLDRGSRRTMERNLVRGMTLMTKGRTAEARSQGAALYLSTLKEMQIPLDPTKNSAISKSIKMAFDVGTSNLTVMQKQMMGRVTGSAGRLGLPSELKGAMGELAARASDEFSRAQFEGEFKPEKELKTNMAGGFEKTKLPELDAYTTKFSSELDESIGALDRFIVGVDDAKNKMMAAIANVKTVQEVSDAANKKDIETLRVTIPPQTGGPKQDSWMAKLGLSGGQLGGTALQVAGVMALMRYGCRGGFRSLGQEVVGVGRGAKRLATGTVGKLKDVTGITRRQTARAAAQEANLTAEATANVEAQRMMDAARARTENQKAVERKYFPPEGKVKGPIRVTLPSKAAPVVDLGKGPIQQGINFFEGTDVRSTLNRPPPELKGKERRKWYSNQEAGNKWEQGIAAKEAADAERIAQQTYQSEFKPKTLPQMESAAATRHAQSYGQPITEAEKASVSAAQARKAGATEGTRAATRAEAEISRQTFGKSGFKLGRGAAGLGIMAAMMALPSLASAAQGSPGGGNQKQLVNAGDLTRVGVGAAINTAMFKGSMGIKKGGLAGLGLAVSDMVTDKIGDSIGGAKGEAFKDVSSIASSATMFGLGNIGQKGGFKMGAMRGGAGAAIGIGSELLRNYVMTEDKVGYTASAGQGLIGAGIAGAFMGGPIGTAINMGMYGYNEAQQIKAETQGEINRGRGLEGVSLQMDAESLAGTTAEDAKVRGQKLLNRLTGRSKELENKKTQDTEDFSGFYGKLMSTFSPKQFGNIEAKELTQTNRQRAALGQAIESGDSNKILEALRDIQGELAKQSEDVSGPDVEAAGKGVATNQLNSQIKVDISVKDYDRIPSELNDTIVSPLAQRLASLQMQVNELINQQGARPAQARY